MRQRRGYTLLEVLVSLAIAVMLFAALYAAVGYQLRHAQAGRDLVEQTMIARAICNRISKDVLAAVALNDPARFRAASKQGGATGATGGSTNTGATSNAGGTPATGTTGGTSSTGSGTTTAGSDPATANASAVQLPLGVVGDSTSLTLFISRFPSEVYPRGNQNEGQLTSDLRRVSYWLASDGGGLCRWEALLVTSEDATTLELPIGDEEQHILAPEVKSIEFQYFDGTSWLDSWNSTTLGSDNLTPLGSPRLIAIRVGMTRPGANNGDEPELKYHRHVVAIPTAGGTPTQPTEAGSAP